MRFFSSSVTRDCPSPGHVHASHPRCFAEAPSQVGSSKASRDVPWAPRHCSEPPKKGETHQSSPFFSYINMIWMFHRINYVLSCHVSIILLTAFILPDMIWKVQIQLPFNCVILAKINTDIVRGWQKTMANPWEQDRTLVAQRVPRNLHTSRQVCLSGKCRRQAGGGSLPQVSFTIPLKPAHWLCCQPCREAPDHSSLPCARLPVSVSYQRGWNEAALPWSAHFQPLTPNA